MRNLLHAKRYFLIGLTGVILVSLVGVFIFKATIHSHAAPPAMYTITDLGTLGGTGATYAYALNNRGQVVVWSALPDGTSRHAAIYAVADGSLTDIGTYGNYPWSNPAGINDAGEIVGAYSDAAPNSPLYGFLWSLTTANSASGVMTSPFLQPGDTNAPATGINAAGQVVGWSHNGARPMAYLWTPTAPNGATGARIDLGTLSDPAAGSYAFAINAPGHVVGMAGAHVPATALAYHAFLWAPSAGSQTGAMTDLGTLGGANSQGQAINTADQVVGKAQLADNSAWHAFLAQNGAMTDLGTLGGTNSDAESVNDAGVIVGNAQTASGAQHAFRYDAGAGMIDLNTLITPSPDWELTDATAINAAGMIVGYGYHNGMVSAYLLRPTDTTPPQINAPGALAVDATSPQGAAVTYTVSATDPDNAPAEIRLACTPASGSLFAIGDATVTCAASDPAGNQTSASFTVHVRGAIEQLQRLSQKVAALNLPDGAQTSLIAKLNAALAALAAQHPPPACQTLTAFMQEVNAQAGQKITAADATDLMADAARIQAVMGCAV